MLAFLGRSKNSNRAGIALTAEGMAFAELSPDEASPTLKRCGFSSTESGNGDRLHELLKRESLTNARLGICLDRSRFNLSMIEAPAVEAAEMRQALSWRVKDLIDYPLDKLVLDYVDVPATKSAGSMVYAVTSHEASIQEIVDEVNGGKGVLERIDIPALVLQNLASRLPFAEEGIAMLNLTRRDSLLTLGRGDKLYLARGIDARSLDLQQEQLREDSGLATPLLEGLLLDVQRSLDYYDSFFADPPIRHLVIPSLGSQYDGLVEFLGQNLAISVHPMQLEDVMLPAEDLNCDAAYFGEQILAIGTALWRWELVL